MKSAHKKDKVVKHLKKDSKTWESLSEMAEGESEADKNLVSKLKSKKKGKKK